MFDSRANFRRWAKAAVLSAALVVLLPTATAQQSAVEREAIEAAFARADTNGDGKLSREEAQRFPEIAARFDEFDKGRKGYLTFDEFAAAASRR
jgi:Ca2+-binding EF-hand superfamily protein